MNSLLDDGLKGREYGSIVLARLLSEFFFCMNLLTMKLFAGDRCGE
jgi:hypothetical protein